MADELDAPQVVLHTSMGDIIIEVLHLTHIWSFILHLLFLHFISPALLFHPSLIEAQLRSLV